MAGKYSPGDEVAITEFNTDSALIWAKSPLGWSATTTMTYKSGALFEVTYRSGCAVTPDSAEVRFDGSYTIPADLALSKYGHTFDGWRSPDGALLHGGDTISGVRSDVILRGEWTRDPSVLLIRGDVNCDGEFNLRDVAVLMRYVALWDVAACVPCADINYDMKVNARDIAVMMRIQAGYPIEYTEIISAEEENAYNTVPADTTAESAEDSSVTGN